MFYFLKRKLLFPFFTNKNGIKRIDAIFWIDFLTKFCMPMD